MGIGFTGILGQFEQEQRRKLAAKVPQWGDIEGIRIPGSLALEQCSSSSTALYKASLAPGGTIADLTSGLGVDVWAFAHRSNTAKVFYNDLNPELSKAAEVNFRLLGLSNVEISASSAEERLESMGLVDMIFIDPARRSSTGSKVFKLEDCTPNLLDLLPRMWEHTEMIMAKLSPMADISAIASQLPELAEIHILGSSADCKELLCILRKGWSAPYSIKVVQLAADGAHTMELNSEASSHVPLTGKLEEGDLLLEPYPALAKAGLYSEICRIFNINQLDPSTHLYTIDSGDELEAGIGRFFKVFKIIEIAEFGKKSFAEIGRKYPTADVSAKNIPMKSEELRKRMGISGSSRTHIFGVGYRSGRTIIVTEKM